MTTADASARGMHGANIGLAATSALIVAALLPRAPAAAEQPASGATARAASEWRLDQGGREDGGSPAGEAVSGGRRIYATGMVGSTLGGPASVSGGTAAAPAAAGVSGQGAIGVEIPQPLGTWRAEFEGRRLPGPAGDTSETTGDAGWTTTANAWRELPVVGRAAAYAGGGAGFRTTRAAGGADTVHPAWQAGGGIAWAITDRVTFDVGGRINGTVSAGSRPSAAPEAEVVFAIRVFEPFRGLLR